MENPADSTGGDGLVSDVEGSGGFCGEHQLFSRLSLVAVSR